MELRKIILVAKKDFLSEWRGKEGIYSTLFFAFTVIVIFNFAFSPGELDPATVAELAPGILWVAFAFAGVLSLERAFSSEKENQCLSGLRLAPVEPGTVYLGKLVSSCGFMFANELMILPFFAIMFHEDLTGKVLPLAGVLFLGTVGFASVGTLFSAITASARTRQLLLPLLMFPVTVPVVLGAVKATGTILAAKDPAAFYDWMKILIGFDLIFVTLCTLLFGNVFDE